MLCCSLEAIEAEGVVVVVIGTLWGQIKKYTILMWCLVIAVVDIEVGGDK